MYEIDLLLSSEMFSIYISFLSSPFFQSQLFVHRIDFFYLWISSTICLKFECESYTGDVADEDDDDVVAVVAIIANAESLVNSKLSSEMLSVGLENDIKSVSLVFDTFRLGFRCALGGGGANEPLLDDVGNDADFPVVTYGIYDELPNEPGRGRVTE